MSEILSDTVCLSTSDELIQLQNCIAAIGLHDELALQVLYDATLSRVYGLALRITRNKQSAEEVTEDVFWQVWRNARDFDPKRGSVIAWLLMMTRSRALDYLRRQDLAETSEEPESLVSEVALDENPQDLLCAIQNNKLLNAALLELEPIQRQLIAMAFFRGLTHEEITEFTGIALGTVKSHIRRALKRLQGILAEHLAEGIQ